MVRRSPPHLLSGRPLRVVVVAGPSMAPLLPAGSWVLVRCSGKLPRLGQVVVAEHPQRPQFPILKRVSAVSSARDLVWLAGDNRQSSSDSDQFGPVRGAQVVGVALLRLRPLPWRWLGADPARLW